MDEDKKLDPLEIKPKKKTSRKDTPPPLHAPPPGRQSPPYPFIPTPQEDEALKAALYQQGLAHGGILRRLVAGIIDWILLAIASIIILVILFLGTLGFGFFKWGFFTSFYFIGIYAVLSFFYFWIMEASPRQATIGKSFMQIRVVDDTYFQRIDLTRSLFRTAGRLVWSIPLLGVLLFILDGLLIVIKDRRIGDFLGHTIVVKSSSTPSLVAEL